jgi:hypothetical protein
MLIHSSPAQIPLVQGVRFNKLAQVSEHVLLVPHTSSCLGSIGPEELVPNLQRGAEFRTLLELPKSV